MSEPTIKSDPIGPLRRQVAELDAETQHEQKRLRLMLTHGHDHFHAQIHRALPQMGDADLDGYTREASALAAMTDRGM